MNRVLNCLLKMKNAHVREIDGGKKKKREKIVYQNNFIFLS